MRETMDVTATLERERESDWQREDLLYVCLCCSCRKFHI